MTSDLLIIDEVQTRFYDRLSVEGDCWVWTGGKSWSPTAKGYYGLINARLKRNGHGVQQMAVHRAMWKHLVGPIDQSVDLNHLCRVTLCCNPAHLQPCSRQEHMALSPRARRPYCVNGHVRVRGRKNACPCYSRGRVERTEAIQIGESWFIEVGEPGLYRRPLREEPT